jgi:hypothetical protein
MKLYSYIGGLLFFLGTALAFLGGHIIAEWRPQLSYLFKHTPLCWAENLGLISPKRAHYSEKLQRTIDILRCAPGKPPQLIGGQLSNDLIVVSDLGGLVQRISRSGQLLWQRGLNMPHGLEINGDRLLIGEGRTLRVLSVSTGNDVEEFEFDQPILMARQVGNDLFLLMDLKGVGAVRRYTLTGNKPTLIKSSPVETRYARGLYVGELEVYVADTFAHRVIKLDYETLDLLDQVESFFPNSVQVIGNMLLVSEEHRNVITEFTTSPLLRAGMKLGCQKQIEKYLPEKDLKIIYCDRFNMAEKLFSPNDAVFFGNSIYVADTDNHRVVEFRMGRVASELIGFNNPVNIRVIHQ